MEQVLKLTKNIFSLFGAKSIEIVSRLVTISIITRYLGIEKYGEYAFVCTFVLFFLILANLGVEEIVTREVSKLPYQGKKYLNGAISIRLILFTSMIAFFIIITAFYDFSIILVKAMYFAIATQICFSFINLLLAVMRGLEKMEYEPLASLIIYSLFVTSVIYIKHFDIGFISLFQAYFAATIVAAIILSFLVSKTINWHRLSLDFKLGRSMLQSGYAFGISTLLLMGSFHVDIFVLKYLKGATDVALFQLPYTIILRLSIIPVSFITALFPILSRLSDPSGLGREKLKNTVIQAYKFLLVISLLIVFLGMNFADEIILILAGTKFLKASISFQILIWLIIFSFNDFLQSLTLVALDKQRLLIIQNVICLIVNLMLDLALVPWYGYIGACIATLIAFGIRFLTGFMFISKSITGIPICTMMLKPILSFLVAGFFVLYFSESNIVYVSLLGIILYLLIIFIARIFTFEELRLLRENIGRLSN